MLGINNRDLGTFKVDLQNNKLIMDSAPGQQVHLQSLPVDCSLVICLPCLSACMASAAPWCHQHCLMTVLAPRRSWAHPFLFLCSLELSQNRNCCYIQCYSCANAEQVPGKAVSMKCLLSMLTCMLGWQVTERDILIAGESGIFTPEDVAFVQSTGCGAILVGESLVKTGDPAAAVRALLS